VKEDKQASFISFFWDSNLRTFFLPPLLVNILCFFKMNAICFGELPHSLYGKKKNRLMANCEWF
jgi:hypothetical protein